MTTIQQDKNALEQNMLKLINEFHEKHPGHLFSHATLHSHNIVNENGQWVKNESITIEIRVK